MVVGGGKSIFATSNVPQTHFERTSNAPQALLKRISNAPQTHFKRTSKLQKSSKINKFAKSPSPRAAIPRFGFLVTNSIIKDQKSAVEMAIRPSQENFINKDLHVATWDTKIVITRVPGHPPVPEFGMYLPTISPKVLPCPKGIKNN